MGIGAGEYARQLMGFAGQARGTRGEAGRGEIGRHGMMA